MAQAESGTPEHTDHGRPLLAVVCLPWTRASVVDATSLGRIQFAHNPPLTTPVDLYGDHRLTIRPDGVKSDSPADANKSDRSPVSAVLLAVSLFASHVTIIIHHGSAPCQIARHTQYFICQAYSAYLDIVNLAVAGPRRSFLACISLTPFWDSLCITGTDYGGHSYARQVRSCEKHPKNHRACQIAFYRANHIKHLFSLKRLIPAVRHQVLHHYVYRSPAEAVGKRVLEFCFNLLFCRIQVPVPAETIVASKWTWSCVTLQKEDGRELSRRSSCHHSL